MTRISPAGSWSRRRVLATALGAAAAVPLGACSAAGGARGRIRVAFPTGGSQESLDPHTSSLFVDQARAKALFDRLADYADDMHPVPRLAESWEPDATGRRWRIRLRRARFHDGRPVTAADVLYSYRRIADPATSSPARSAFAGLDFTRSGARSERELELVLHAPNFEFPASWAAPATEIVPGGTREFSSPVGSGPFRFRSFEPGARAVFTGFDGHWSGPTEPAELEFVPIDDESARVNALLSGQVHYAHDVSANSSIQLDRDHRTRVLTAPAATMQAVACKVDRPPFSDPRVLKAIELGVDRRALVDIALNGRGEIGNDLFGKGLEYYPSELPQRVRDPDMARSLLREAGASKLTFELDTSGADPYFEPAANMISQQLSDLGLRVTPRKRLSETYYSQIKKNGVAGHTRTATLPIPTFLGKRMLSNASGYTGFASPEFDAVFRRALATADAADRARLLVDAQRLVRDHSGLMVWGFSDWNVGVSAELQGLQGAPPNSLNWARFDRARLGR